MRDNARITDEGRREFLKLAAILSSGSFLLPPFLAGCNNEKEGPAISASEDPFEILRKLKEALRKSPDHLPALSKLVVNSKNPEKIFEFVRDNIQTLPNCSKHLKQGSQQFVGFPYRWGTVEDTLRYGKGTSLEKAFLLKSLLLEAGFKAKIMEGDWDLDMDIFWSTPPVSFKADLSLFRETGKKNLPAQVSLVKIDEQKIDHNLDLILKQLPANFIYPETDWKTLHEKMYEVEVETPEGKTSMNPSFPDIKSGNSKITGKKRESYYSGNNDPVTITLSLLSTSNVKQPVEFVRAQVPAKKLFGNQLIISFPSPMPTKQLLYSTINNIKTFTPAIGLAGLNLTAEDKKKYCFTGKSIHINGDSFEAKDKKLFLNGEEINFSKEEHVDLRNTAAEIKSLISSDKYPRVDVSVNVTNKTGEPIPGLGGKDFEVLEDGKPITFSLVRNALKPYRVLLLFDLSKSVPEEFRKKEKIKEVSVNIMQAVKKQMPNTEFRMCFFNLNKPIYKGVWTNSEEQMQQDIESLTDNESNEMFIGSELWSVLSNIARDRANIDVITFITDGKPNDSCTPEIASQLLQGCPVITLGVGEYDKANLEALAKATQGRSMPVSTPEEGISFLSSYLDSLAKYPYQLAYKATTENNKERKVTVSVKGTKVSTTVSYLPPEASPIATGWIGIILTVEFQGQFIKRSLAGVSNYRSSNRDFTKKHQEETEIAFFNDYRLIIERADPTYAVLLEEMVDRVLTQEPCYKAIVKNDSKAAIDALDKGFFTDPPGYLAMMSTFRTPPKSKHYQDGLNAVIFSHCLGLDGSLSRKADILPFSKWRTKERDPQKAFSENIRHSLRQMTLEKENYALSSMQLLEGKELRYISEMDNWLREMADTKQTALLQQWDQAIGSNISYNDLVLVPANKQPVAYYKLDKNSGSICSILPDGSGGGSQQEVKDYFDRVQQVIEIYSFIAEKLGLVGAGLKFWAELAKWEAYWVAEATLAIASLNSEEEYAGLDSDAMERDLMNRMRDFFCDKATGAYTKLNGEVFSEVADYFNQVLNAMGLTAYSICTPSKS